MSMTSKWMFAALAALAAACSGSDSPRPRVTFAEPVVSSTVAANTLNVQVINDVLIGDVNGDGRPDVLLGFFNSALGRSVYSVHLNAGGGRFDEVGTVFDLRNARLADFNGDGRLDLVGCDRAGVRTLLGGGDGRTWTEVATFATPSCEESALGDFDGDGKLDFAFGMRGAGSGLTRFAVLKGLGNGTFVAMGPVQLVDDLPADRPGFLHLLPADFNGDRRTDLAVTFETGAGPFKPQVRLSRGDGTFERSWPAGALPDELASSSVGPPFAADLNGDGRPDLVMAASGFLPPPPSTPPPGPRAPPIDLILVNHGDGTFTSSARPEETSLAAVGDIDNDGRVDLVHWTSVNGAFNLVAAFGRGDATFGDDTAVILSAPGTGPHVSPGSRWQREDGRPCSGQGFPDRLPREVALGPRLTPL